MRFGPRRPSFKKRIAARTSWEHYVRHSLGWKAPRGMGWLTNPKKAAYNRVYHRTTFDIFKVSRGKQGRRGGASGFVGLLFAIGFIWLISCLL